MMTATPPLEAKLLKINRSEYRVKALHKLSTSRWFVLDYDQGLFYYKDKADDDKNWSGVTSLSRIDSVVLIRDESNKDLFGFSVTVAGQVHVEAMCPATSAASSRFVAENWVAELKRGASPPTRGKSCTSTQTPEDRVEDKVDKVKLIIIGDAGVGKTCLARGYVGADLDGKVTMGVDFLTKHASVNGAQVKLQIYDTAGQEKYNSMNRLYYRDARIVFIVFDLTDQKTFDECETWLQQVHLHCNLDASVVVLIGNKRDMVEGRQVSAESAEAYARANNLEYFETAGLFKDNVDMVFKSALQRWSRSPPIATFRGDVRLDQGRDYHKEVVEDDVPGKERQALCPSCAIM